MSGTRHGGGFVWIVPPSASLIQAIVKYGDRVLQAAYAVATYMALVIEAYARQNARWTDRTGNARAGLHTLVDVAAELVVIYLTHGVDYGKYLETIAAGKWAIIMPALQAHYGQVMQMFQEMLD